MEEIKHEYRGVVFRLLQAADEDKVTPAMVILDKSYADELQAAGMSYGDVKSVVYAFIEEWVVRMLGEGWQPRNMTGLLGWYLERKSKNQVN